MESKYDRYKNAAFAQVNDRVLVGLSFNQINNVRISIVFYWQLAWNLFARLVKT